MLSWLQMLGVPVPQKLMPCMVVENLLINPVCGWLHHGNLGGRKLHWLVLHREKSKKMKIDTKRVLAAPMPRSGSLSF
jgi:hypothetical protein